MPQECWALQDKLVEGSENIRPTLLEICQDLHMYNTGSCDSLHYDKEVRDLMVYILETALNHWVHGSKSRWKAYDDAVLHIVQVTLNEYYTR